MNVNGSLKMCVLVLAGGRGSRFWPLSRKDHPKQCLAIMGGRTLLQATVDRLAGLCDPSEILVATGRDMEALVREQLPEIPAENFLVEPRARNTAPCIAWSATEAARRWGGDAVMTVLPADHVVTDVPAFQETLAASAQCASETNSLVTIGIRPTRAETGFGYLWLGGELGRWRGKPVHRVRKFVEKPDRELAERFYKRGEHLWNAGMFCWTIDAIRDSYREYLPGTWAAMEELAHHPHRIEDLWSSFDATSIDYGVMERSRCVLVAPASFGWSDVGAWTALPEVMNGTDAGWLVAKETVVLDARGNIVHARGKLVALLGVSNLVVVDTPDVLMVADKERAQEVKRLTEELEARLLTSYL